MDNLKLPAYPITYENLNHLPDWLGFTKLEMASLMIAQGIITAKIYSSDQVFFISKLACDVAKAVLEEANK